MNTCRCGCGSAAKGRRVFVNKQHQLRWMRAGGARELNALQPLEAKERGGHVSGQRAAKSGRLRVASAKGVARIHEIMREEATK